ncbi:MAG TPA: hypothetical protein VK184_26605 [Nostocaceae cyanobacterium]|nr:hypothetical protein [Nostocaceae cyanobacterium]
MAKRPPSAIAQNLIECRIFLENMYNIIQINTVDPLISIVTDTTIKPDAWGDHYLEVAIDIADKLSQAGELQKYFYSLPSLDAEAKVRLIQVIINFPSSQLFELLFGLLVETEGELAEVLIDGLRTWPLDQEQKQLLLLNTENFRGQSKLLDIVIDEIAKMR